jgi:hypothetical protein
MAVLSPPGQMFATPLILLPPTRFSLRFPPSVASYFFTKPWGSLQGSWQKSGSLNHVRNWGFQGSEIACMTTTQGYRVSLHNAAKTRRNFWNTVDLLAFPSQVTSSWYENFVLGLAEISHLSFFLFLSLCSIMYLCIMYVVVFRGLSLFVYNTMCCLYFDTCEVPRSDLDLATDVR